MMSAKLSFVVSGLAGVLLLLASVKLFWMHVSWWFSIPCLGVAIICLVISFFCFLGYCWERQDAEEDEDIDEDDCYEEDDEEPYDDIGEYLPGFGSNLDGR